MILTKIRKPGRADPVDGITGEEDQKRGEEQIPAEVYEAAGRAYCLARYTYSPAAYVSDEARERHIARDALDEARQPSTRAAVNAAVRLIVARYERALREQKRNLEAVHDEAYRAGREDLLRSGSCPECTAGDPHNEPDVPHIHLTPYGYLLYAADHERPGFIEEIRAAERRAGREDAAQDIERVARSTRESLVCTPPEYAGEAAYHRTRAVAFERAAVIARGDGVQPTEDAARNALIIRGDLDITTVVAALDRAGFDCPDDALRNASADLLQRLPVWQGSDGRYRPRIPKVDQPGGPTH
jgi:hypothetical protein